MFISVGLTHILQTMDFSSEGEIAQLSTYLPILRETALLCSSGVETLQV